MPDLEEAIRLQREALENHPRGHPDRYIPLLNLAGCLSDRFRQSGSSISDLNEAITLNKEALDLCPRENANRSVALINLVAYLSQRYRQLGVVSDLDDAITHNREALELCPQGHPHRPASLINFAICLSQRYKRLGVMSDLDEAITCSREALDLRPRGHPDRSDSLINLAPCLVDRFTRLQVMSDLDEAIMLNREALDLCPPGHPDRSIPLINIVSCLSARFSKLRSMPDLDEAIALNREALELCPRGHLSRSSSLLNLANCLSDRFHSLAVISDLDEAIVLSREALELCPPGHSNRFMNLIYLATCLIQRFRQLGSMSDLEEAITLGREALDLTPPGHHNRSTSLIKLTAFLSDRFKQLGGMSDLDEVITLSREALDLIPSGNSDRSFPLNILVASLSDRFGLLGEISNLDEAITLNREALELCPPPHPNRFISVNNLAACLSDRFKQLGVISDIDEAIRLHRDALDLCTPGHPDRSNSMINLAACLSERFRRLGEICDLDEAITFSRDALEFCPREHRNRCKCLANLAGCLSSRFKRLRAMEDLDEAIMLSREALDLSSQGNTDRTIFLVNLVACLSTRFEELGVMSDLDEAITLNREAYDLRPPGHPGRSIALINLTSCLSDRFQRLGETSDLDELFILYSALSDMSQTMQTISLHDLTAARRWIHAAERHQHHTTVLAYQTSLRLLVSYLATLPSLPQHHVMLKSLSSSLAVDAFSACVRHNTLSDAVELVEQGRSVFWSQLVRLRSPLDDVRASGDEGKQLAEKFIELTTLLRRVLESPSTQVSQNNQATAPMSQHEQAWHWNVQLQQVVSDIRKLPDLSRFLLPPSFSDLRQAASAGPVIIVNASQYSCDALIVLLDQDPVHVPLPITKARVQELASQLRSVTALARTNDVTRDLVLILREVWNLVVSPIVDVLQELKSPTGSRIWWCPTAEFSLLPLHAAGPYGKTKLKSLSDLYISSYTPTLSALIRARQDLPSESDSSPPDHGHDEKPHFLAVGQAQAPGENVLACVNTELDILAQRVSSLTTFTCLKGPDATLSQVTTHLRDSEFIHLACHGIPDYQKPFSSAFALGDGHLQIQDLMYLQFDHSLRHASEFHAPGVQTPASEAATTTTTAATTPTTTSNSNARRRQRSKCFAYLSACHTMVGDGESPDEVIHLAAAMQFLGFRSVIGTMWGVEDRWTGEMTGRFYAGMVDSDAVEEGKEEGEGGTRGFVLDHTRAAVALHKTLRNVKMPFDQRILYIHIGA